MFHSILIGLPVPDAEKHPHSMMLLPVCFTVGMVFDGETISCLLVVKLFMKRWDYIAVERCRERSIALSNPPPESHAGKILYNI